MPEPTERRPLAPAHRTATNQVSARDIRHFAQAIGEGHPRFHGEGPLVDDGSPMAAPPLFGQIFAFADLAIDEMPVDLSPIEAAVDVPAERTVGGSSRFELFEPICAGDTITSVTEQGDVRKKTGSSGDLYLVTVETSFYNQNGVLVCREEATYVKR